MWLWVQPATSGYDFELKRTDVDRCCLVQQRHEVVRHRELTCVGGGRHGFEFCTEMLDRYYGPKLAKSDNGSEGAPGNS